MRYEDHVLAARFGILMADALDDDFSDIRWWYSVLDVIHAEEE
jgi:hypothetical protein